MVSLLLTLSIICWNAAFFGNAITAWFIIPSVVTWIWLLIHLTRQNHAWWNIFIIGGIWGLCCLYPQFWWMIRGTILYSHYAWNVSRSIASCIVVGILFSVTQGLYAIISVFICRRLPLFTHHIAIIALYILYQFYLANLCFIPLGETKGYPFFWPFLPLGRSAIFLNTLRSLRHQPNHEELYQQLSAIDFFEIPQKLYPLSELPLPPHCMSERISRSIAKLLPSISPYKPTVIITPESAFPFPVDQYKELAASWQQLLPPTCQLLVATRHTVPATAQRQPSSYKAWLAGNDDAHDCQTIAWLDHTSTPTFFDKQELCPFAELGVCEGQPHTIRGITIDNITLVPVLCYDFFRDIHWLSTLANNEIPILQANELWFPYQTYELIHNFIYIVSIWYDKPVIYAAATKTNQPWQAPMPAPLQLPSNHGTLNWSVIDLAAKLPYASHEFLA